MKTETITLPAQWASALINGDFSGCSEAEEKQINSWIRDNPHYGACLNCSGHPELLIFDGFLTECLEYTFPAVVTRTADNGLNYLVWPAHQFERPLAWQKAGLTWTRTGYGAKIATTKAVYIFGRMYRIYCTIYSNVGTCWINYQGRKVIIS